MDVDHREPDRDAADDRLRRHLRAAAENGGDVGARAAHVEREHVTRPGETRDERRAGDARRRAGENARRGTLGRGGRVDDAAGRLHHERRRLDLGEIGRERRREVGVRDDRRAALVLAELGQQLDREGDARAGQRLAQRLADAALVLRMQEGEEEAHGDRLDPGRADRLDRGRERALVERHEHAVGPHALAHGEPELARDERRRVVRGEVVERGARLAADLDHVAEALGRHERGPRPAPLEQGVRRDRRPVREDVHLADARGAQRSGDPACLGTAYRRHLRGDELTVHHRDEIGERAADVHTDRRTHPAILSVGTLPCAMATTKMPSSLEIAQAATLRPIAELAAEIGLEDDEVDLYGRYKAKVDLSVLERLADRPNGKLIGVTAITPTKAGEGKTTTAVGPDAGAREDRQEPGALPARGVARPRVRDQGRRGRRGLLAGRADGGPEPPLHRRHPRDRSGEQPALGDARGAHPARQRARDRPADGQLASLRGHERPRAALGRDRPRRPRERLRPRDRLRHHRRLRGDGDHRGRARPVRPAQAARRDHGRLHLGGRAGHRRAAEGGRGDDRPPQGRDQAEPRPDARGPARVHPLRPVREHRPRQLVAGRRPRRAEARRLRRHRVRLRRRHGDGEAPRHRLPGRRALAERDRPGRDRAGAQAPRRRSRAAASTRSSRAPATSPATSESSRSSA